MKLKCISNRLNEDQRKALGFRAWEHPQFRITPGQTYSVLGLTCRPAYIAGTVAQICSDDNYCIFVPLCLFEIVNDVPSRLWRARLLDEHTLALWPEEFYSQYFHDDLSNGEASAVEKFARVRAAIEHEQNGISLLHER